MDQWLVGPSLEKGWGSEDTLDYILITKHSQGFFFPTAQ